MRRALLALSALLLALSPGPPAAAPIAAPITAPITKKDTEGRSWSLLSPGVRQLDLLFFVATDCPISNRYAPEIVRLCTDYRLRGVRCFMVYPDAGADVATIAKHRREFGFGTESAAIVDRDHALVGAVGARVTPEAAVYSSAGRVYRGRIDNLYVDVGRARQQATRHDVRLAVDAALAGLPAAQPETEAIGCFITN
jgi:hypothetical protein